MRRCKCQQSAGKFHTAADELPQEMGIWEARGIGGDCKSRLRNGECPRASKIWGKWIRNEMNIMSGVSAVSDRGAWEKSGRDWVNICGLLDLYVHLLKETWKLI